MAGIGSFKRRVTLKMNPTKVANGSGGFSVSGYGSTIETWANVNQKGGQRVFDQTGKDMIEKRKQFDVFYRAALATGLSKDTVIEYLGKEYQIDSFDRLDEDKRIIRIEAVTND